MFLNRFLKCILTQGILVEFIRKLLDDVWMITDISDNSSNWHQNQWTLCPQREEYFTEKKVSIGAFLQKLL
jgi:hypothetical protein